MKFVIKDKQGRVWPFRYFKDKYYKEVEYA